MGGIFIMVLGTVLAVQRTAAGTGFDPVSEARGGTWLRNRADPWATVSCQGLLSFASGTGLAAMYSPGMFGLRELSRSAVALSARTGAGGLGCAMTTFGYRNYRETELTAGYGGGAGVFHFGGGFRLRQVAIPGYGSTLVAGLDVSLVVRPVPRFLWGVRMVNINRPAVGSTGDRLGPEISAEITMFPVEALEVTLHAGNEYNRPLAPRAGLACRLSRELTLACGASGDFSRLHAGIETDLPGLRFGYALSTHPDLGWTHLFSLGVTLAQ